MKGTIVAIATSMLAVAAMALAFAPGVLAQTPNPQGGAGNGVGPGAGNSAAAGARNPGVGMGIGMGMRGQTGMGGPQSSLISVAAHELGLTNTELVTALGGTKSIAQVAAEHNVAVSAIVDAFLAPRIENLNAAVAAGRITQAQADAMLATMRTNVTEQVNAVWTPRGTGAGAGSAAGAGFLDADGDGVCDNMGAGGTSTDGAGRGGMMGQGRGPRR